MTWWKKYGFRNNPLDIRPNENLIGVENIEKEVVNSIENGEMILLYGPMGCGKTSLAYKIMKEYKEKFNFIYLNGENNQNPDINKYLNNAMYKKVLFFKFRNRLPIVLILDEFYNFSTDVSKKVKYLYDNRYIHSVLIIQINEEITNAFPSFINRIYKRIPMDFPDEETIVKIIETRLKNKIELDKDMLKELIRKNGRNIRSIFIELSNLLEEGKIYDKEENKIFEINGIKITEQQKKILSVLIGNRLNAKRISEILNIPISSATKQLSRLYQYGILLREERGKNTYYYINPKYLNEIVKKIGK